eukprot:10458182-Heterocapsa_arctica.AAC.1
MGSCAADVGGRVSLWPFPQALVGPDSSSASQRVVSCAIVEKMRRAAWRREWSSFVSWRAMLVERERM